MQSGDRWSARASFFAEVVSVSVVEAVERDLAAVKKVAPDLASSTLAASALALALELDTAENSATSKAACARTLVDVMAQLRSLMPEKAEGDKLDDLAARRASRLARRSAS